MSYAFRLLLLSALLRSVVDAMNDTHRRLLRDTAKEMFYHAYNSYMENAYPADELMPLSCKGRVRGREATRGDVDDALGRFSLTLIDSMDTLAVLGDIGEFSLAAKRVVDDVSLDTDIVVSVFETNIRVLGGLLSSHVFAELLRERKDARLRWYRGQLLELAEDMGRRLLPAFNTTTGIPHARVNLRHGVTDDIIRRYYGNGKGRKPASTCTACAGSLIMEFAALSRLSGNPIYEQKAHQAMESIWASRNVNSNLVGSVIDIDTGAWIRQDSGIGAGTDSYYEYCLKSYVLLGNLTYWDRFSKHYNSVMRYVNANSGPPAMVDVMMSNPLKRSKSYMDSLLAFWPGLQVLAGDLRPAIELHHMLYHVMKRHKFLPEAFTVDYQVHWAHHPLRPEFIESTYFLYTATKDSHYLQVGELAIESLQKHARVPCGFAAVSDVRTLEHEDRMDSFVLAETFKYLYLLFADESDIAFDMDDFVFTTEAHLLPLTLANVIPKKPMFNNKKKSDPDFSQNLRETSTDWASLSSRSCPNVVTFGGWALYADSVRDATTLQPDARPQRRCRVDANAKTTTTTTTTINDDKLLVDPDQFSVDNPLHIELISLMGITLVYQDDGSAQLVHNTQGAATDVHARQGIIFMQKMLQRLAKLENEPKHDPVLVEILSPGSLRSSFLGGPALFGAPLVGEHAVTVYGLVVAADPPHACSRLSNDLRNRIALIRRGNCMFMEKARNAGEAGALGAVIVDNVDLELNRTPLAMSGDGTNGNIVTVPSTFVLKADGDKLYEYLDNSVEVTVRLGPQRSGLDRGDSVATSGCSKDGHCSPESDDANDGT